MSDKKRNKTQIKGGFPGRGRHRRSLMGPKSRANDTKATINRLKEYLNQERSSLTLVIIFVSLSTILGVIGPFLMAKAIDSYILNNNITGLARITLIMLVVYLASTFFNWMQTYVMIGISQKVLKKLRADLFSKLQTLSLSFFDKRSHGELMSRLTNDIENINATLTQSVTQLIASGLSMTGVIIMMLYLNYRLAIISLLTIPFIFLLTKKLASYTRKGYKDRQMNLGKLNGLIEETITGQRVVKLYCREKEVTKEFIDENNRLKNTSIKAEIYASLMHPMMNLINNLGFVIVGGVGGWMAIQNLATIGTIAAFLNYSRQFSRPLQRLASLYNAVQAALAGAERVFEIIDEDPEIQNSTEAIKLTKISGRVVFKDVNFSYTKDKQILKNINFVAEPGQMIALVGPTGAGKTTIVNLLTRFYDINSGSISIDGHNLKKIELNSLRSKLGIVLQDTYLFSESVKENIRYGRLNANDDEIFYAAKLANADHFIRHLPEGYDTVLSEEGNNLSQGQRQLIAIARAILANPAILILDEATSSIDSRTEMQIQEAMIELMKNRTSFVIAHRLSTIKNADQILVINDGKIIENGTHQFLLNNKGFYYNLYHSQFKDADAI